jgi:hypothetical protein
MDELLGNLSETLASSLGLKVAGTIAGALVVLITIRLLATRLALRGRIAWAALPADEFDPTPEDVSRFAFQIARVRRAIRGWFERPASAVRIRLDAVPEGQMLYVIEGPEHARSVLRAATYNRVVLRDLETLDLTALSIRPDLPRDESTPDEPVAAGTEVRSARGEPPTPESDDPREDLEHDWLREDRW